MRLSLVLGYSTVRRHLAEAEERISQQRICVADTIGLENARALSLLDTYLEILEQMQIHRLILNEELRLCRAQE